MKMIKVLLEVEDTKTSKPLLAAIINYDRDPDNSEKTLVCVPYDLEKAIPEWSDKTLRIKCTCDQDWVIGFKINLNPPDSIDVSKEPPAFLIERFMFRVSEKIREYLQEVSVGFLANPNN